MWWSKKSEPQHTQIGQQIYDSLCIEPLNWINIPDGRWGLFHPTNYIYVEFDSHVSWQTRIRYVANPNSNNTSFNNGGSYYPELITLDDYNRIYKKAQEVQKLIEQIKKNEEVQKVIERHNPALHSKFDDNVRALAKFILKNDMSAAMPFLDACMENMK